MTRLTFESPHNINDIVFVIREDGSVVQGCVTNIILMVTPDTHELRYEVVHGSRSGVFCRENVYSDPHDAFSSTYKD